MPALNAAVTAFITRVKNDLSTDPGVNFCKAQDLANVLRLLAAGASAGTLVDVDINEIMNGKNPSTGQHIGEFTGMKAAINGFNRLIEFASGTMPTTSLFASTALLYNTDALTTTKVRVSLRGEILADQFRGKTITVDTTSARIVTHDALGYFTLDRAITAVAGGETVTVVEDWTLFNPAQPQYLIGGQPGENAHLAYLIEVARAAVVAIP